MKSSAPIEYTEEQVLEMLLQIVRTKKMSQSEIAAKAGVSPQYVSDVMHGRRSVGEKVGSVVGLVPVLVFRPLHPESTIEELNAEFDAARAAGDNNG